MHDVFLSPIVCIDPYRLEFVSDRFKTEEMCNKAVHREPYSLGYVPDHLKAQEICDEALHIIYPDEYERKGICNKPVSLILIRHRGWGHEYFL